MRRIIALVLSVYAPLLAAECEKRTQPPISDLDSYYAPASGLSGHDLRLALNNVVAGHTKYSYTPCVWAILKEADEDPQNSDNVLAIYTNRSIPKSRQDRGNNDSDSWNREHIWAKSHGFPKKSQHAYTDAHHIRAADRSVNADRSDHDFDVGGVADDECQHCREGQGTWEPPDRVKGDIARMMFYMDVRYEGNDGTGTPDLQLVNTVDTQRSKDFGQFGKLCTLLDWHIQDPVTSAERRRNDVVQSWQGNRNPFIDRPSFAQAIWGQACGTSPESHGHDEEKRRLLERLDAIEAELQTIRQQLGQ